MRGRRTLKTKSDANAVQSVTVAPAWLSKDAKAEWQRVMPILVERRILTDADLASFENYCVAIGQVREMERLIKRAGHVVETDRGPRAHPAVKIQSDAMTRARLLASELGLTPVRGRVRPSLKTPMTMIHPHWVFNDTPIADPHGRGERAARFFRALRHPKSRAPRAHLNLRRFGNGSFGASMDRLTKAAIGLFARSISKSRVALAKRPSGQG